MDTPKALVFELEKTDIKFDDRWLRPDRDTRCSPIIFVYFYFRHVIHASRILRLFNNGGKIFYYFIM